MYSRFRLKLTLIIIAFAIIISISIAIIDHTRLKEQAIHHNQIQVQLIEEIIENSLKTIEKAYFFFDQNTEARMEAQTQYLLDLYEESHSFDEWDFLALKDLIGFDIYIINDQNVITFSTFADDIGLDFDLCCSKLAKILDERRNSGGFFADGMDIEQKTGEIKKYSYMATKDKKYLIELGYSLENGEIFKEFNFFHVIHELKRKYSSINEINVLTTSGYTLGEAVEDGNLSNERREAFKKTLSTKKTTEIRSNWGKGSAVYRYIPYTSEYGTGLTKYKVLEIIYNDKDLQSILSQNRKTFYIQLFMIITISVIMSFLLSKWISKPMYLAFHDSLTGLKNRAAFEELLKQGLEKGNSKFALMVIDLDNFKLVNDYFGHDGGDSLLKIVAQKIQHVTRKKDIAIRIGGDEFILIMPSAGKEEAEAIAKMIIEEIKEATEHINELQGKVTASIGISYAPDHGIYAGDLYKKADIALYASKEKGKNQYHIYQSYE